MFENTIFFRKARTIKNLNETIDNLGAEILRLNRQIDSKMQSIDSLKGHNEVLKNKLTEANKTLDIERTTSKLSQARDKAFAITLKATITWLAKSGTVKKVAGKTVASKVKEMEKSGDFESVGMDDKDEQIGAALHVLVMDTIKSECEKLALKNAKAKTKIEKDLDRLVSSKRKAA